MIYIVTNGAEDITVREKAIWSLRLTDNARDILESLVDNEQEPQILRTVAELALTGTIRPSDRPRGLDLLGGL